MSDIKLPDFEDMNKMVEAISALMKDKQVLSVEIDVEEANIMQVCMKDTKYSPDGKLPSATYINGTYKVTGINGELIPKRYALAEINANLEKAVKLFDVMKMQFEAWRTNEANKRANGVF